MKHLSVDIETYSGVDLRKAGLYKYARSPDFEVMLIAYAWGDDEPRVFDLTRPKLWTAADAAEFENLKRALKDADVIKHAYNAGFEWYCLNYAGIETPVEQWRCTMAQALYCGYPAALRDASKALGLPQAEQKDVAGTSLIRLFCVPSKPNKANSMRARTYSYHEPERWETFKAYCAQDVVSERACGRKLAPWPMPEREQKLWRIDILANARGVRIDRELVRSAIACASAAAEELTREAVALCGLDNPNNVGRLTQWLSDEMDEDLPDLQRARVAELLERGVDSAKATRLLEIRQELGKSSVAKYRAMDAAACNDGRLRGLTQYYGASRTGRYAGRIVQPQNLPRQDIKALDYARELAVAGDMDGIKLCFGSVLNTLSQLLRTALVPSHGNVFAVADFSAIEARVIAWLAGETWRNQVFATHGKIYEASASAMFGVPLDQITKDLRQKGKVAELALGFGGGAAAMERMGALKMGLAAEELPDIVTRWRQASPNICRLWYDLENAALRVMGDGNPLNAAGLTIAREFDAELEMDFLTIQLPSGRKLYYARPFFAVSDVTNRRIIRCQSVNQITRKWEVNNMWHGRFVENVVQAIARDCLAEVLLRAHGAGMQVVLHVHDEVIVDTPEPRDLDKLLEIMSAPMPWAPDLLLKGDGYVCNYYRKD